LSHQLDPEPVGRGRKEEGGGVEKKGGGDGRDGSGMAEDGKNCVHVTTSGKEANYVRYALGILKGEGDGGGQLGRGGSKVQLWAVGKAATKCVSVCEIVKRECGGRLHQWTGISSAPAMARSENDDGNGDGDQEEHDDMVDEDEVRFPALFEIRGRRADPVLYHMRGIRTRPIGRRLIVMKTSLPVVGHGTGGGRIEESGCEPRTRHEARHRALHDGGRRRRHQCARISGPSFTSSRGREPTNS
jgi:hypothetical protein